MPTRPLDILLVRHAEPILPGDPRFEENDRPLSPRGVQQARDLAAGLAVLEIEAVYSSPYPRALQTVEPIAESRGLEVTILDNLRERLLSPEPLIDWRERFEEAWRDHDLALPGGESGRAAQARVMEALAAIAMRHLEGGTVVAGSHGNLIALALNTIEPRVDHAFWAQIPMPAVYAVRWEAGAPNVLYGPGF